MKRDRRTGREIRTEALLNEYLFRLEEQLFVYVSDDALPAEIEKIKARLDRLVERRKRIKVRRAVHVRKGR